MQKIFLSATPVVASDLAEILRKYEGTSLSEIVDDFEKVLREYTGSKYVVALNSGTASIHLALKALGVGPGDTVLVPTFTYVATLNPIIYLGADPILIDSEPTTWNISPSLLEVAIKDQLKQGRRPRCLIVVHGYGMPAMMDEVQTICSYYGIPILEDAAAAIGSAYRSKMAGTIGEVGIYSFNNNKILTTYGGGALITQNEEIYKKAMFWANQSRENMPFYEHTDIGFSYRMGPLNAASGLLGMQTIEKKVGDRRAVFEQYRMAIKGVNWLPDADGCYSNRWLTTALVNPLKANQIWSKLMDGNIEFRRMWNPMHLQPFYRKYPAYLDGFAEKLFSEGLCLPSGDLGHVPQVVDVINSTLSRLVTSPK